MLEDLRHGYLASVGPQAALKVRSSRRQHQLHTRWVSNCRSPALYSLFSRPPRLECCISNNPGSQRPPHKDHQVLGSHYMILVSTERKDSAKAGQLRLAASHFLKCRCITNHMFARSCQNIIGNTVEYGPDRTVPL